MKQQRMGLVVLVSGIALLIGCGGGGGGGGGGTSGGSGIPVIGDVLSVETGAAPNPPASVQVTGASVNTSVDDGSYSLRAPAGTNRIQVATNQPTGERLFTFAVPPISGTSVTLETLWIGPRKATVTGRILNALNGTAIPGAQVRFAGHTGATLANGRFSLPGVAYPSGALDTFWLITGNVTATDYFRTSFSAFPVTASGGVVNVGDIRMVPSNDPNPPGGPFNITGRVLPTADASGTVVTLRRGLAPIRTTTIGAGESRYYFWTTPGTYTITFQKGNRTAPNRSAKLNRQDEVIAVPDTTLAP